MNFIIILALTFIYLVAVTKLRGTGSLRGFLFFLLNLVFCGLIMTLATRLEFVYVFKKLNLISHHSLVKQLLMALAVSLGFYGSLVFYKESKAAYWVRLILVILLIFVIYHYDLAFYGFPFLVLKLMKISLETYQNPRKISVTSYLNYIFFPLTFSVGPIMSYAEFERNWREKNTISASRGYEALELAGLGLLKFTFFALVFSHFAFDRTVMGFNVPELSLILACSVAYYFFIYCSFSGLCEISKGLGILIGFNIPINFKDPLLSRNIQDHWNRWHMTFLHLLRDIFFYPVSLSISRIHRRLATLSTICGIWTVFLFLGLWQGHQIKYYLFSSYHATGLSVAFLFGLFKKSNSVKDWRLWNKPYYSFMTWLLTFIFISISYFIYATPLEAFTFILGYYFK